MSKQDKRYEGSVDRNIYNFEKKTQEKYIGKSLEEAKHMLGVRQNDTKFDTRINTLIKKG